MELRELKSLHLLAKTGSLSETARLVHLTPAAIHKQLKHLEEELGVPLYEKGADGLAPTTAADVLMPYVLEILSQQENALSALEEWKGVRRGLVRIGAGPALASYVLPEFLERYHKRFPLVELDVHTGSTRTLLSALQDGNLDMALVVAGNQIEDAAFSLVLEKTVELWAVTALEAVKARCSLKHIANFPFLMFGTGTRIEEMITSYWNRHGLTPNAAMRFDSAEALKATLRRKIGVAIMPAYTVKDEVRNGTLRRIRIRQPLLTMKLRFLTSRSHYISPAVKEMAQVVSELI